MSPPHEQRRDDADSPGVSQETPPAISENGGSGESTRRMSMDKFLRSWWPIIISVCMLIATFTSLQSSQRENEKRIDALEGANKLLSQDQTSIRGELSSTNSQLGRIEERTQAMLSLMNRMDAQLNRIQDRLTDNRSSQPSQK